MEALKHEAAFIDILLVCCGAWVVGAVAVALAMAYLHEARTRSVRIWTLMAGINMLAMTGVAVVVKEIRAAEAQQAGEAVATTTPLGITGLLTSVVTTIASFVAEDETVPIDNAVVEAVGGAFSAACFLVGLLALWGRDVFLPSFWPCWMVCLAIVGLGLQDQCEASSDATAIKLCSYHRAAALMVVPTLFFSFAAWTRQRSGKRKVD